MERRSGGGERRGSVIWFKENILKVVGKMRDTFFGVNHGLVEVVLSHNILGYIQCSWTNGRISGLFQ